MKNPGFEGWPDSKRQPAEEGALDILDESGESIVEYEDELVDPLEAGHREADKIALARAKKKIQEQRERRLAEEREKIREEDREELKRTYRRF